MLLVVNYHYKKETIYVTLNYFHYYFLTFLTKFFNHLFSKCLLILLKFPILNDFYIDTTINNTYNFISVDITIILFYLNTAIATVTFSKIILFFDFQLSLERISY